jgi:hypothetical protein
VLLPARDEHGRMTWHLQDLPRGRDRAGADGVIVQPGPMRALGVALLQAAGASPGTAATVVDHLIESSLMGLHSHGVLRIPQYLDEIEAGEVDPAAERLLVSQHGTRLAVDGRSTFGQVAGVFAADQAASVAAELGTAVLTVRHGPHRAPRRPQRPYRRPPRAPGSARVPGDRLPQRSAERAPGGPVRRA